MKSVCSFIRALPLKETLEFAYRKQVDSPVGSRDVAG